MEVDLASAGRVVCFGEVLLRLSAPGDQLLLQSAAFDVCVGGAEANVAVSLARLGAQTSVVTILPDNPLGRGARDELRRHGVDTTGAAFVPGRMGIYYLTRGAVLRPAEVTYDRAESAFARGAAGIDWDRALEGAAWLHVSGVTPAVGPNGAKGAVEAVRAARRRGLSVSFDGNFRASMWATWNDDPAPILTSVFENADIAFADERDIGLLLGRDFSGGDVAERRALAAAAAFEAFPNLQRLCATVRTHRDVAHQELSAMMFTRQGRFVTGEYALSGIVERIGAGDAFAAGVLHGLMNGSGDQESLEFGLAAACLKHSIPGDFNLVDESDIRALMAGGGLDVRR